MRGLTLRGGGERYWYANAEAETPLVSEETEGWRWNAGATYSISPAISLDGGYQAEFGPGAASQGGEGAVSVRPISRLTLTAEGGHLVRPLEFRDRQPGADLVRPLHRFPGHRPTAARAWAPPAIDENRRRADASTIDWSQTRLRRDALLALRLERRPAAASAGGPAGGPAMRLPRLPFAFGLVILLGAFGGAALHQDRDVFDHEKHHKVFPECQTCHAGDSAGRGAGVPERRNPAPTATTGRSRRRWTGPHRPRALRTLRFTHAEHVRKSGEKLPADSALVCTECHIPVRRGVVDRSSHHPRPVPDCHGIRTAHFSAPDTACGTCHFPLAEATALPETRVAKFEKPASHDDAGFLSSKGHGEQAKQGNQSCAVCHARDFCTQCHVNAPEVKAIQALAPDPRSLAIKAELKAPASHKELAVSSRSMGARPRRTPRAAHSVTRRRAALPATGPGRRSSWRFPPAARAGGSARGSNGRSPATTPSDFADQHGPRASSSPGTCNACHARAECLECHRPNAGGSGNYHPAGFLTRHPAAAFNRQTDCASCHNQAAFCITCHQQAGWVVRKAVAGVP